MSQSPVPKAEKQEDFECSLCDKTFQNQTLYQNHVKTKHPPKPEAEPNKPKADISPAIKAPTKSKGGFQQYQQDLEDKIFAFLGELGEKNVVSSDDFDNNAEESDKMMGQSNYIENTIVKTPYEAEFDIVKALNEVQFPAEVVPAELLEVFKHDISVLWQRLAAERETWEFCDPIQLYKYQNEEFTLVNVPNVIRNYKKKGIPLDYPELAIFVLWLTKTCKAAAWKQLYTVLAYTTAQYFEFRQKSNVNKDKTAWKNFNQEYIVRMQKEFPKALLEELSILKPEDIVAFLKLYSKWVSYFGLE